MVLRQLSIASVRRLQCESQRYSFAIATAIMLVLIASPVTLSFSTCSLSLLTVPPTRTVAAAPRSADEHTQLTARDDSFSLLMVNEDKLSLIAGADGDMAMNVRTAPADRRLGPVRVVVRSPQRLALRV